LFFPNESNVLHFVTFYLKIPDPVGSAFKNLSGFNPNTVCKLSEIRSGMFPDLDFLPIPDPDLD
jgi:hypothetical protein